MTPEAMTLPKNVLVVGRAKTGTTVIAKSIQHALAQSWDRPCGFALEPKRISYFDDEAHRSREDPLVVKLIHDHWAKRTRLRNAILGNELDLRFDRIVFITRDPRDELISRLMYLLHVVITRDGLSEENVATWRAALAEKEANPQGRGLFDLAGVFNQTFGTQQLDPRTTRKMCKDIRSYWALVNRHADDARAATIRYEDFIAGRLDGLSQSLGVPLAVKREMGNLDRVRRSEASGNWATFMTQRDLKVLQPLLADDMAGFGYTDWELTPVDRLPSGPHTDYVDKVVGLLRK